MARFNKRPSRPETVGMLRQGRLMDAIEAQQKEPDGRKSEPARGLEPKEGRLRAAKEAAETAAADAGASS